MHLKLIVLFVIIFIAGIYLWSITHRQVGQTINPQGKLVMWSPPSRTKTSGCVIRLAMPDPACTPGAVDRSVTWDMICPHVKRKRHTLTSMESVAFASYGFSRDDDVAREDDHLISIELGGADNIVANHFPQRLSESSAQTTIVA